MFRRNESTSPEPAVDQPTVDFDKRDQYDRIAGSMLPGEQLFAVYDMRGTGTGFVGLTDRRLIVQDEGRIRKRKSLVSIPYSKITMISSQDEGGAMFKTSELTIFVGSQEVEFEFRHSDKAERAYKIILNYIL